MKKHTAYIRQTFAATALSTLAALPVAAAEEYTDKNRIYTCIDQAVNAVQIPNARAYLDNDDGGYKKYLDNETTLAGITTYLNPYGENIDSIENAVHFMTKFYHEGQDEALDFSRAITMIFTQDGVHHTDHGFVLSGLLINSFEETEPVPPSEQEIQISNWVNDAANTMAIHFTVCMNFEPYEVGGWANADRPIQPPTFPEISLP